MNCGRGNAAPPVRLTDPITNLGDPQVAIIMRHEADSADGVSIDLDRPMRRAFGGGVVEPNATVGDVVRVWKMISKVIRHVRVVGVLGQRFKILRFPRTNDAATALNSKRRIRHETSPGGVM